MTTQMGKDWRLQFGDGANAETFATLGGEKSFDWSRDSNDVDTSDKDGPSGVLVPGRIKFSVSGNLKLPDAALLRAYNAAKTGSFIDLKVMNGTIVKFAGQVTVGNWKGTFGADGPVPYSFDMANAAVPTTDDLGAAA